MLTHADRIVVVDTETTGVYPTDRVVEIALVTLDGDGLIVDEWDTLVDPQRDVGPTWIHGVTASMVRGAPTFEDVAAEVAARLHGAVIAAHNLPFDGRMLTSEYRRLSMPLEISAGLDTLRASRLKLADACAHHDIRLDDAHAALADARATAQLLLALAGQLECCAPVTFATGPPGSRRPTVRRAGLPPAKPAPPPYLASLTARLHHVSNADDAAYLDVLDRAMADLHLDVDEQVELAAIAAAFGLNDAQTRAAHRQWLDDLIDVALDDHVLEPSEYEQLCRAAATLALEQEHVERRVGHLRVGDAQVEMAAGMKVCFTGLGRDPAGGVFDRATSEDHARWIGLEPVKSVTKKNCDLLVAADGDTSSEKARKARRYSIPIVDADDFHAAAAGAVLPAKRTVIDELAALVCEMCGRSWTRPAGGRRPARCPDCSRR